MTETRFYHLQNRSIEQALPSLLLKALETGRRVVVKTESEQAVQKLNEYLWTYSPDSFLPHGCASDGDPALQPVWLTAKNENPNAADTLILPGNQEAETDENYTLVCKLFDARDETSLGAVRMQWKTLKDKGADLTYWQQNERGGWDKKA